MYNLNFEDLKNEIKNELIYPKEIVSTRRDATGILGISIYKFDMMRKLKIFPEYKSHGVIFFNKDDLMGLNYSGEVLKGNPKMPPFKSGEFCFEELERRIRNRLTYPEDKLLTRKTAPTLLKISTSSFDKLRREGAFFEYEHLGTKFFDKEELAKWDPKKDLHITNYRFQHMLSKSKRVAV